MKVNLAATKTNLWKARKSLALTAEGHELLDEKRRILMQELTGMMHSLGRLEEEVDNALQEAYTVVDKAVITMGRLRLEELSFSIDIRTNLVISQRRVMGVTIPVIRLDVRENPPYYSPHGVSFYAEEARIRFKEILTKLATLAEKKIALLRLAKETQKTIRKVNALEKIYIPYFQEACKEISDRLDEDARDAFSILKLMKRALKNSPS